MTADRRAVGTKTSAAVVDYVLEQLDAISRTCASWDGTDPVRFLTRAGYRVPEAESR